MPQPCAVFEVTKIVEFREESAARRKSLFFVKNARPARIRAQFARAVG
jgi:hypothetical protein